MCVLYFEVQSYNFFSKATIFSHFLTYEGLRWDNLPHIGRIGSAAVISTLLHRKQVLITPRKRAVYSAISTCSFCRRAEDAGEAPYPAAAPRHESRYCWGVMPAYLLNILLK